MVGNALRIVFLEINPHLRKAVQKRVLAAFHTCSNSRHIVHRNSSTRKRKVDVHRASWVQIVFWSRDKSRTTVFHCAESFRKAVIFYVLFSRQFIYLPIFFTLYCLLDKFQLRYSRKLYGSSLLFVSLQ